MTMRPSRPKLQAEFAVQAMNTLVIDRPAFAPQQHMNALVAVSNAHLRELLDATFKSVLRWSPGLVPLHGSRLPHDQASSPFTAVVVALKITHDFAPLPRLHHFLVADHRKRTTQ